MNLKIISAGAGSGKTYRLTSEMVKLLKSGVRASGIIATTFTAKAAAELQERVRTRLLEEGLSKEADDLSNALIGTVHGLGVKLLKRFAYEAGVSPEVEIIADADQQVLFNQSLAMVLHFERVEQMELLCDRLGLNKKVPYDWRKEVKAITEIARTNAFTPQLLQESKLKSIQTFDSYLGDIMPLSLSAYFEQLDGMVKDTIYQLENGKDETKVTKEAVKELKNTRRELKLKGYLYWWEVVKLTKLKVGAKSKDLLEDLTEFASRHDRLEAFKKDIHTYITALFDMATEAMEEFARYKKQRGLIDYTDMEVFIKHLLDHPKVQAVLASELDLLMVDEFQDTSPIQLELFLKLSKLAKHSIWVGDPKQSIYGFRGAEPQLMQAIIQKTGGVKPEDIQEYSWRSREDIVYCTNALFTKAFQKLPPEQVALKPVRTKLKSERCESEPIEVNEALIHWHFRFESEGKSKTTNREWMNNCIASTIQDLLAKQMLVLPKNAKNWQPALPGDFAVLCRSNSECNEVAEALHKMGLKAAIARAGLMNTAEAKLILACLKYILTRQDTLSVAELLLLAANLPIEYIIEDRLKYLKTKEEGLATTAWASNEPFIQRLDMLREQVKELSSSEILNLILDELDLRRIIAAWGSMQQRLDNVDVIRRMAEDYEDRCNRLHSAASLGGFLLWMNEVENLSQDFQSSGESQEAINVLTYHKSKGLEYPIVICHSLEQPLKAEIWGIDIVIERSEIDLDDVLGGRWLRYWVNPYADQYKGTPLFDRLKESPFYLLKKAQAMEEEARLLYVGITRARDYLIFPSRDKPMRWLNRVWQEGNEDFPTLDPESNDTPWYWENKVVPIRSDVFYFDNDFQKKETPLKPITYIEPACGPQSYPTYKIDLRKEDWTSVCAAQTSKLSQYAAALPIADDQKIPQISKAFKAFLVADWLNYPQPERLKMAQEHLQRFGLQEDITATDFVHQSTAYYQEIFGQLRIQAQYRKFPIQLHWDNRLFDTVLDLVLLTPDRVLLYQNSGFSGDAKRWRKHAVESLGAWSYLSKTALQRLFPRKKVETWVHFVIGGSVLLLQTEQVETAAKSLFE